PDDARGRARINLERGRVANTAERGGRGRTCFLAAWDVARAAGEDALAVDAAHMLGIVEPPELAWEWNERGMALARGSPDPAAQRWIGSIANNMGWARHDAGAYAEALELFTVALAEQRALAAELEAVGETDEHVTEEIGECLRELGRT